MEWFLTPAPRMAAAGRLFCLPYAGGGAAIYRDWGRELSEALELRAVQLPGRGWRLNEPPSTDLTALASDIAGAIEPLADRPFALFGHSMGAWLALLVARHLEQRGLEPMALLVSGRQAPSLGCTQPPLSHLDDEAFVAEVQLRYGGIPSEILADRDILMLLLPSLRADIRALEHYLHESGPRVHCPIVALGGEDDPLVPVDHLAPWATETVGPFQVETFPGDHFYFRDDPLPLLRSIERHLARSAEIGLERIGGR